MNKPFSNDFVIRETLRHMQNSVSISTQKTIARLGEFRDDAEKTKEVMVTLHNLSKLNNMIEEIKENNSTIVGDKNA
jgi:hypothetical protein